VLGHSRDCSKVPSFPWRVALISPVKSRAQARPLRRHAVTLLAAVTLSIVATLVPTMALAEPQPAEVAPEEVVAVVAIEQRAYDLLNAAELSSETLGELLDAARQIESWIFDVESKLDDRAAVAAGRAEQLQSSEIVMAAARQRLAKAQLAVSDGELSLETVETRNRIPELHATAQAAVAEHAEVFARFEAAQHNHARAVDVLMIAWSLRQEVGTTVAEFQSGGNDAVPAIRWTGPTSIWAIERLDEAQDVAQNLPWTGPRLLEMEELVEALAAPMLNELGEAPDMIWPVVGAVNSGYGMRIHPVYGGRRLHTGMDVDVAWGEDVVSVTGGIVVRAGWNGGYGNTVEVDHGDGTSSLYAHLSEINVELGSLVARGDLVGLVGATGTATSAHLHFEIREDGEAVDPALHLP